MEISDELIAKVAAYQPDDAAVENVRQASILFLVGVSGAGKDTVCKELPLHFPGRYHRIITHTTRRPRENDGVLEQDGRDYHFISPDKAEELLDTHGYIEANFYSGNIYGTSVAEIAHAGREGRIAFGDIDVNGVAKYVAMAPETVKSVFLLPPDFDVWQERLLRRYKGHVDQTDLTRRLQTALDELEHALQADHFYFVVNDNLENCVQLIDAIARGKVSSHRDPAAIGVIESLLEKLRNAV